MYLKKTIYKIFFLFILIIPLNSVFSYYYEPNSDIKYYLDDIEKQFNNVISHMNVGEDENISPSVFSQIAKDFSIIKTKFPQKPRFKVVYSACEIKARALANGVDKTGLDEFNGQCFSPWQGIQSTIKSQYTVKARIKATPKIGNAPLNVTLSAIDSTDPSGETIPSGNYYWYYTDDNGNSQFIGNGPSVNRTFDKDNAYVVHLTTKSVNKKSKGILDGSASINIDVRPPIAKINLFINGQKAIVNSYVKISDEEGKKGVLFDATGTVPDGETRIQKSSWVITEDQSNKVIYKKTISGYPGSERVKLIKTGVYFVKISIFDNTGKKTYKKYKLIVSNPVSVVNVMPKEGNTQTVFHIDAFESYSINGNITKYKWVIKGPNGGIIEQFEGKQSFKKSFLENGPGKYTIKLEVEDVNGNRNDDVYILNVVSTQPVARFVYDKYDNWKKPSTFIFDASYSYDDDKVNGDILTYIWDFSNKQNVKTQYINSGKKMIATFDKKGKYKITLTVRDKYGKTSSISKVIKVKSVLRPIIDMNSDYYILGTSVGIRAKSNKSISYYEYLFGDGKSMKTKLSSVVHTYKKSGIYNLVVKAYSLDGDSNSITKKVFIGQKGVPFAVYEIYKNKNQQLKSTTCTTKSAGIVQAFEVDRKQSFTINARKSVNGQGTNSFLKIYFQKDDEYEYINKSFINLKMNELGCRKITLYVKDLNTNKLDKKNIYFKVVNAKPVIKDIKMFFPQYMGKQSGSFQPRIGNSRVSKDIFASGFDPLLVKITTSGYDKDGSVSYFRWYYYKKGDRENPVKVKITPYNIPEVVFPITRIPGEYIFGVDICDVDDGCTNSEDSLNLKPVINIPNSMRNPNYPQINSVRIDSNTDKGIGEINVGEKIYVYVDAVLPSKNKDFKRNRVFKFDFDNDGKRDFTSKTPKAEYVYKKPYKKHRIKAVVLYRGNQSNPGYSAWLTVKKGVKTLVDTYSLGQDLLFYDLSVGDIEQKSLCFDIKTCKKKNSEFLIVKDKFGHIHYDKSGKKLLYFWEKDSYGNKDISKKSLIIKEDDIGGKLLTLPRKQKINKSDYSVNVAGLYTDSFILYYKPKFDANDCFIDQDITVDTNNDGDPTNDKDKLCDTVYKMTYKNTPKVILQINDQGDKIKLEVNFDNLKKYVSKEYKDIYNKVLGLISKYAGDSDEDIKGLVKYLSSLLEDMDDKGERDVDIISINDWLEKNPSVLEESDELILKDIVKRFTTKNIRVVVKGDSNSVLDELKDDLETYLEGIDGTGYIIDMISQLEQTTNKDNRKDILQKIYKALGKLKNEGKLKQEYFSSLKQDICKILTTYRIQSKACSKDEEIKKTTSTFSKILGIIGRFALAIFIIFAIIVIIFVFKAKQRREENEPDEE